jgi:hypothetical protein
VNWDGKSEAEWQEIWAEERLREDAMLAFHDEVGDRMTKKALAAKFNLKPTRVSLLIRRRVEARERESMLAKIERLEELRAKSSTFTSIAERLWMDLGWLATEIEKRRQRATTAAEASSRSDTAPSAAP